MCSVVEVVDGWEISCSGEHRLVLSNSAVPNCILNYNQISGEKGGVMKKIALIILLCVGIGVFSGKAVAGIVNKEEVCMVNNSYMGKAQIPVDVNGKTYYGCCAGCVSTLQHNESVRYAIDPISNNKVDKSDAFIIKNPSKPAEVLYFETRENALSYLVKFSTLSR